MILLINIDSRIPNLALKKIERYYLDRDETVIWDFPLMRWQAERIYVSCIFDWNKKLCDEWEDIAEIGGTGYSLKKTLPVEIENINPEINLGFTTRGCIRNCHFCIVPKKEGYVHIVGDIYNIWDGKSKDIILLDNNILALPEHFKTICSQLRQEKIRVDFNQGLDIRLLTVDLIEELKMLLHKEYKFAWDVDINNIEEKLKILYNNFGRCLIYVLCGFLPFKETLKKFEIIKSYGHNGYAMRHSSIYFQKEYIALARWVNQHQMFQTKSFDEFVKMN